MGWPKQKRTLLLYELEQIRLKNNGFLRPKDVLKEARSPKSPLHLFFSWNEKINSEKFLLIQAANLIKEVHVTVALSKNKNETTRMYISLSRDRHPGGGYRAIAEILDDENLTKILLTDALAELNSFKIRYTKLKKMSQLSDIFEAIERLPKAA